MAGVQHVDAQTSETWRDAWTAVEQAYRTGLDDGIVGSSLVVWQNGAILGEVYHGYADIATKRPIDAGTIYHWGSITKTFTGLAIMQLRDHGLLALDDPVIQYLPELHAVHNPFGSMEAITIRQLMSHSAGFRGSTWPWGGQESWHPHEPMNWDQLVAMLPYTQILFEPGSQFSYSNPAIIFLGRIIEQLTGDDYEVYIDKNIFKPLQMYTAYFDHTPYHLLLQRSNNYYVVDGETRANGLDFDTGITVSNGGLNASIPDLLKYIGFLVGDSAKTTLYNGVLARASLEEMWEAQVPISEEGDLTSHMGLTFFLLDHKDEQYIGHTGSQKAFQAFFYVHPTTRSAAITAYNTIALTGDTPPAFDTRSRMLNLRALLVNRLFPVLR